MGLIAVPRYYRWVTLDCGHIHVCTTACGYLHHCRQCCVPRDPGAPCTQRTIAGVYHASRHVIGGQGGGGGH